MAIKRRISGEGLPRNPGETPDPSAWTYSARDAAHHRRRWRSLRRVSVMEMGRGSGLAPLLGLVALCLFRASVPIASGARAANLPSNSEVLWVEDEECQKGVSPGPSSSSSAARSLLRSDVDRELWRAAKFGNLTGVEEALEKGADIRATFGRTGTTALSVAAQNGHLEVVELLIRAGSNVNEVMKNGWTPVVQATTAGHLDVLLALLRAGASPYTVFPWSTPDAGRKRFKTAKATERDRFQQAFVSAGLEVEGITPNGVTPLMVAVNSHYVQIVEALLRWGARVNQTDITGLTPLHYVYFGKGGDVIAQNTSAAIIDLLIDAGADVDKADVKGYTALFDAAAANDPAGLKALLRAGAAVNAVNGRGDTPLFDAVYWGNLEAVRILVGAGADVSVSNKHGETPWSLACACSFGKNGKSQCSEGMCKKKTDLKQLDKLLLA